VKPEQIKAVRKRLRWTQAELARALGCSLRALSDYERGISPPKPPVERELRRLAEVAPLARVA
jgi:transcriptional regulator with XRE-family HTH domain